MQAIAHDGTKLWSTRLAVGGESGNETITPLLAGGVVVAAQDGMVTGLGEGDGRVRWTWRGGTSVYGMWRSGQTVVVLTDQVGDHARFTALQTSDGHERWHLAVAPNGILGNVVATLSGGLAWVRADGAVQYMRMSDGRVRWSHPGERSPALIELDGRVVFAASGAAKAYDQATGRLEWTAGGLPPEPLLTADAGLVLVSSRTSGGSSPTAVTALDPASGAQRWRYDNGNTAFVLTGQGNRILLVTGILAAGMTELDSATGQPIWRVNASVQSIDTAPLLLAGLIVNGEGGVAQQREGQSGRALAGDRRAGVDRAAVRDAHRQSTARHRRIAADRGASPTGSAEQLHPPGVRQRHGTGEVDGDGAVTRAGTGRRLCEGDRCAIRRRGLRLRDSGLNTMAVPVAKKAVRIVPTIRPASPCHRGV